MSFFLLEINLTLNQSLKHFKRPKSAVILSLLDLEVLELPETRGVRIFVPVSKHMIFTCISWVPTCTWWVRPQSRAASLVPFVNSLS